MVENSDADYGLADREYLRPGEVEAMIRAAKDNPRCSRCFVISIAYHPGLRAAELSGLKWDAVDLKAGTIAAESTACSILPRRAPVLCVPPRRLEVSEHVGKTGLVAIYKNGDGPTIMVRTELDALPIEEKTGVAYASHGKTIWQGRETFVAHSCGHDIHMASWVGRPRRWSA